MEDTDIIDGHDEEALRTALLLPLPQEPRKPHRHNQPQEAQRLFLQFQWRLRLLRARIRIQIRPEGTMGDRIEAVREGRANDEERPGM